MYGWMYTQQITRGGPLSCNVRAAVNEDSHAYCRARVPCELQASTVAQSDEALNTWTGSLICSNRSSKRWMSWCGLIREVNTLHVAT